MKKILLFGAAAMIAASASAATEKEVLASFYDGSGAAFGGWGGTFEQVEEDGKPCLKYSNAEAKDFWAAQMAIDLEYEIGQTYYFSFDVKGTGAAEITSGYQYAGLNNAGEQVYWGCGDVTPFSATSEWKNVVISGETKAAEEGQAPGRWVGNLGQYVGDLYITNVEVYIEKEVGGEEPAVNTKDMLPSLSNDAYDAASKTITFDAAWGWINWWFGEGDFSEYDNFVLEFEPVSYIVQVMIQYAPDDFEDQSVQAQPGESKIVVPLNPEYKNVIKQIAIQNSEPGTLTLTAAYFATESGVKTAVATPVLNGVYNLQGVKVADEMNSDLPKGIYIVNGKKVVR